MTNNLFQNFISKRVAVILLIVLVALISHSYNAFHFPYYEADEGTYMSQAWSVVSMGKLAPHTYSYDHAPAGWILIALWSKLTMGFSTFGFSINSGRALMILIHIASSLLLYSIAKRLTKSEVVGLVSALLFSLSPLAIHDQRRVLLDNIMVFWVLFSLFLAIGEGRKLRHFMLSAVAFGIAILTKEPAIFFLPGFLYIVFKNSQLNIRRFAVFQWFAIVLAIVSVYFLYALLKNEFFQSGTFLGGDAPHVSFVETMKYQLSRDGGFFLSPDSDFRSNLKFWLGREYGDPIIIVMGILSLFIVSVLSFFYGRLRVAALLSWLYILYLIRGGNVIGFYILPLLPFLALNVAICVKAILIYFERWNSKRFGVAAVLLFLSPFLVYYATHTDIYTKDQTSGQIAAVEWMHENIRENAVVLIDNYAFIELNSVPGNFYYYWKAERDPEIKANILKGDWRNVDYLLATPQMTSDIADADLELTKNAYMNSSSVKRFEDFGWYVEIRSVN
ncbi:hypothetical protein A3B18_01605 [Candidatus Giovannonibacteria bacterium RIFCSPLOWO2_01_FULL_46_13]|uniref:Glycosyltransferase RgtA/B/C/D-like domain-containing protein n=1 Tax=Candidatus Giovannonibacteria bacterium RIFCSPLOWO2_01_FULL_46_13 TaxID=1798352 RepID=A0A1F5X6Y9_9BACT|nr:MAG: hypothetical protein A3B18_01605 [Candidatus Giovannonibacteria bacterium RIFCSPLOWO2_01_FULL_46_13]